jgi:hypothetical protein
MFNKNLFAYGIFCKFQHAFLVIYRSMLDTVMKNIVMKDLGY